MEKWFQNKNFPAKKGKRGTNARKAHRDINARKVRRALGVLLAAALVFQTLPFGSAAASASEVRGGLCEHHRSHTPDCGYTEAEPGAECTHEHTEDCYKTVEDCIHGHTESCYPADTATDSEGAPADAGERQPAECGHSCSEESGCITKELDCRHEHDGSCGYQEETPGSPCTFVCKICNSGTPEDDGNASETGGEIKEPDQEPEEKPDDGQEECICEKPCKEGSDNESSHINKDCPVCGAEDADLSECKGKGGEEDTQNPEDTGICKHHQAHDESCGYQPASENGEGSPCTYECRICPIEELIAALPDVGSITDENAEDVRAQLDQILALFAELTGEEQEQLDLSRCYELQEALDGAKTPVPAEEILTDAVAEIVKSDGSTTYVDESGLDDAFRDSGNSGATFTLLANVTRATTLRIKVNCTLDLNGHNIKSTNETCLTVNGSFAVTIQGEGEIISEQNHALVVMGSVTLEGGTFTSNKGDCAGVYVNYGTLSVIGENVVIQNTSNGYGLAVNNAQSVQLSGGKYSGTVGAISIVGGSLTLGEFLAHTDTTQYAYFDENGTTPITGKLDDKELTGTVTVKKCNHTGEGVCEYTHATSTTTHQQTCLACGKKWDEENCSYADSRCACGSTLSVALAGTERLIYDGNPREPGVTVTLDGTKLAETDYGVTYANNINAGTDTATVTVKGKENYSFEIKKTFSIEKAEQENFAVVAETKPYEKNGTFTLSTTGGGGDGAVLYRVPENNGVLMVNGDTASIIGVGTVSVTATKAESDNYKAATAMGNITIEKASAPAITYPTAGSITYGQKLSDCTLTGGSTEYGTFAWKDASTVPTVGDTTSYAVVFTASEETKKNYETIINTTQNVPVKVEKAVPAVSITAAVSGSKDDRQAVITVNAAKAGAGAFPTGTVTFIDCTGSAEVEIDTVTLSNGTASYTWEGLSDQEYTIKAVYAGGENYKEAESREFTFDAAKQNQQDFALDAIGAKTYGDAAVTLKTTGGNGSGAVRYESSDEDVIRIEDGRAIITGAGTATITAIKAGDDNYNEASAVRNVTVAKKALTVSADSKTVVRGNPMPAFTYRAEGLVNGDTFTTAPSITAGAQNTDTLGKYDIVISGGTLRNSESYRITYVNGTLNIVERFYTVTVTDGTGGGEYAEGDTVTVTANDRSGYTFTGWSSEDGVGFADSKAKTTTFTMPAKSVTVKANYIRNSSGGNTGGGSGDGGNSGGSGNSGGGNSGDNGNNGGGGSTNPGNGNTTPQPFVTPSTETSTNPGNEIAPGTGTTPVNPGSGNTARPGTTPDSGSAGMPAQGTKQPFIKGADGKIGWDVIRAEEENAEEGSVINVDMNGSTVVPGDIFDSIKGKDITITFDMGSGILWSVDGKNITTDKAGDIDFSVKTGVKTVPVDIINNVTGENYSIQISLAYEGEFGFTAVLSINLGKENAGYMASLYYYNESAGELEFICADKVAQDGTVSLAFTHASDYVIAIDGKQEGGDGAAESAQPDGKDGTAGNGTAMEKPSQEGQQWRLWWLIVAGVLVLAMGAGVFFIRKKKSDED